MKTLDFCNLRCDYCYVRRSRPDKGSAVISDEIVEKAVRDYEELTGDGRGTGPDGRWMVFLWHGGEPTLAGIDFFERALRCQRDTGSADYVINSLTTNGTLIDCDWADFLVRNGFKVSVSIDGPRHIHNRHRLTPSGGSSFDDAMRGLHILRSRNHPFGVICVVSEESADQADGIFDFFVKNQLNRVAFLPRVTKESWLPPSQFASFMMRMFDLWLDHDNPEFYIREFENVIHEKLGGRAELCEFDGCCGSYLAVDHNGDVYLCDLFIGDDSRRIGNILEESLKEMLDSDDTLEKVGRKLEMNEECVTCSRFQVCKGGCLYRRCLARGVPSDRDVYCEYRRTLIDHVSARLSALLMQQRKVRSDGGEPCRVDSCLAQTTSHACPSSVQRILDS